MALANRYRVRKGKGIYSHLWFVFKNGSPYPYSMKRTLERAMDSICRKEKQLADYRRQRTLDSLSEDSLSTG